MGPPDIHPLRRLWLWIVVLAVLAYLIVPIFVVIPVSFSDSKYLTFPPQAYSLRWYDFFLSSDEWMSSVRASIVAAFGNMVVVTPLGIATAYAINAMRPSVARSAQLFILLPMLVPNILIAIGIFYVYIQLKLVNSMTGIVLSHVLLSLPFVVLTMLAAMRSYDFRQEQAAQSLGASRLSAFMRVTLPQLKVAVISSALFAFIISLDEVVVGLFVAGGENTVLTRRMFVSLRDAVNPTVAAISTLFIMLSITAIGIVALVSARDKD